MEKHLMGYLEDTEMDLVAGINCTLPAFRQFPGGIFSESQREHGAIIIHILVVIYLFICLAVVCDDYFVASLGKICEILGFSEDVAGATFMAAGSSAPELFTSLIGVFVSKGDVGTGTIVGSAVFNILAIVGLCAILAEKTIYLNWWPLLRDSSCYSIAIIALILVMCDGVVTWLDSIFMLILYACYIVIMKYNNRLQEWAFSKTENIASLPRKNEPPPSENDTKLRSDYAQIDGNANAPVGNNNMDLTSAMEAGYQQQTYKYNTSNLDKKQLQERRDLLMNGLIAMRSPRQRVDFYELIFLLQTGPEFHARTRLVAASKLIIVQRKKLIREGKMNPFPGERPKFRGRTFSRALTIEDPDQPDFETWKVRPQLSDVGYFGVAKWFIMAPIHYAFYFTIPDCRKTVWEKYFMATFLLSILWIAILSYVMVWMLLFGGGSIGITERRYLWKYPILYYVTLIGHTIGIPETIMGMTFLAAGTSIPDCMASIIVAKQGQGDMAVSNSIGSNVFDILLGLAVPWFLHTALISPGSEVKINSNGLVVSVVLLFLTVAFLIFGIYRENWQLNRQLGYRCLVVYALFIVISCMIEGNVFGYVNPPVCPE